LSYRIGPVVSSVNHSVHDACGQGTDYTAALCRRTAIKLTEQNRCDCDALVITNLLCSTDSEAVGLLLTYVFIYLTRSSIKIRQKELYNMYRPTYFHLYFRSLSSPAMGYLNDMSSKNMTVLTHLSVF